jgi:type IV pilus assembly protein PilW
MGGGAVIALKRARHPLHGFSLVELMVAMTVGLILLVGISSVFVTSKATYHTSDEFSRLQENARFALQTLVRDIRLAGYYGCHDDIGAVNNTLNAVAGHDPFATKYPLEGVVVKADKTGIWYPSLETSMPMPSNILPSTDGVSIRMLDSSIRQQIVKEMPNESAVLFIDNASGLKEGDIVMITDCGNADVLQITNLQDGTGADSGKKGIVHNAGSTHVPGNSTQKLSKSYGPPGAAIVKYTNYRYFVANNANGVPSLFRESNGATPDEIAEGIESLQVLYGKDTDGDKRPDIFLKAGASGLTQSAEWHCLGSHRHTRAHDHALRPRH